MKRSSMPATGVYNFWQYDLSRSMVLQSWMPLWDDNSNLGQEDIHIQGSLPTSGLEVPPLFEAPARLDMVTA